MTKIPVILYPETMKNEPVQFSSQIDSAKANNDRTLTLKIETQELSSEDTAKIFALFQKQIWIALDETSITREQLNIPEVVNELDKKSPSQRLRDRMYVFFKERLKNGMGHSSFDDWYKAELEKIGEKYLERLN